ncbi:MAG: serine/threonine protein kinase [Nitrosomonas sp.]|nr:serine/threonine protein kinase [Nitrosomonas sp.]
MTVIQIPLKEKAKPRVQDERGDTFELERLASGGQGIVCKTQYPHILVKLCKKDMPEKDQQAWLRQIRWVKRQPITDLQFALPRTMIEQHGYHGYTLELMDGLMPLDELLKQVQEAAQDLDSLLGIYKQTGGLKRRFEILATLARQLLKLHGKGLCFVDLSPANVFISRQSPYSAVWLIDCDNISATLQTRINLYTPGYGAPEVVRGECGAHIGSDLWSFAVLAFELLTLAHPFKGDMVSEGEIELEDQALRGEHPWIDHPDNDANRCSSSALPRQFLTKRLQALFEQTFNAGLNEPGLRPDMHDWLSAFEEACQQGVTCESTDCGQWFLAKSTQCSWCDYLQTRTIFTLTHYLFDPEIAQQYPEHYKVGLSGTVLILVDQPIELREAPLGTTLYQESNPLLTLEIDEQRQNVLLLLNKTRIPADFSLIRTRAEAEPLPIPNSKKLSFANIEQNGPFYLHLIRREDSSDPALVRHDLWELSKFGHRGNRS